MQLHPSVRIYYRYWLTGALVLGAAGFATRAAVIHFLDEKPFLHRAEALAQPSVDPDAGLELIEAEELVPESEGSEIEMVPHDAGLPMIDGPAPGPSWARRTKNILLVGVDRKPWSRRSGGLADTIILAALDMRSGHVGLVSIPRDYYIEFLPGKFGRINTAFHYAAEHGSNREDYLAKVVGDLLDVPVHETFIVDLTVLESAIDAVGGVDVEVPCALRDNFIDPRTETGRRMLSVAAGLVHMDGLTAAMYARSRHGRSDWDRARRQQAVILGLRKRLFSFDAISALPDFLDELETHIETGMTRRELLELARFATRIETGNMHGMVLSSSASEHFRTDAGSSVLLPNVTMIREQILDLFDAPSPGIEPRRTRCADVDAALNVGSAAGSGTRRPSPSIHDERELEDDEADTSDSEHFEAP